MDRGWLMPEERRFVEAARRAVLVTVDPRGRPRPVPICFGLEPAHDERRPVVLWTPLDEKPKASADPLALARVRDIALRPAVSVLIDRWSESWTELAWLRLGGVASLAAPGEDGHAVMVARLRDRYPQYGTQRLEDRPMLRILVESVTGWGALERSIGE
jgi:PPOX class probable F420-dependent enzyme